MSKREDKKDHILCAGLGVMKTHGYNGTSVKDIVDAAAVPKGSFYNYFDSKESFVIEALEKVAGESEELTARLLKDAQTPAFERLKCFFSQGFAEFDECDYISGCFFGNMCQEMSGCNDAIRRKVSQILKRKTRLIADVLREAQEQGLLKEELNVEHMAEFLFNAWEGAVMRMKSSRCKEPLDAFLYMLATYHH